MDDYLATQGDADFSFDYPSYEPDSSYFPSGKIFNYPEGDDTNIERFNDRYLNVNEQYFLEEVATNPNAVSVKTYMLVQTKILADIKNFTVIGTTVFLFVVFANWFRRMLGD